jgi:3-oxoacyl-[acyl-carrier protein] reductase
LYRPAPLGRQYKPIGSEEYARLASEGCDVAFTYKGNVDGARETEDLIKATGRRALVIQADASDPASADQVVKETVATFGRVDILVNNAGTTANDLMMRMSLDAWRDVIDTNLSGAFYMTKAVTRLMVKAKAGRIIFITSVSGQAGQSGQTNYSASKAGLIGLTRAAARELGSRNITVNAIAPGVILTDMTSGYPMEMRETVIGETPLRRIGSAEDVAGAIVFFASDDSSFITGQVLAVDGGLIMR